MAKKSKASLTKGILVDSQPKPDPKYDMQDVMRAAEIMKDPKRVKAMHQHATETVSTIQDLRDMAHGNKPMIGSKKDGSCPECGTKCDSKYCPECGEKMGMETSEDTSTEDVAEE